ncbi:MAG: hypothetical protein L3J08_03485 [Flavobacteriaceae bacterium]|nr:hypothetical protein [Flavobacteriaceae bacterium]
MNQSTNKTMSTNKDNNIFNLSSILFNRKKPFRIIFSIPILMALLIFGYLYYIPDFSFILFVVVFISLGAFSFLTAPKKLIFNQKGIQYHVFWKVKWSNFADFTYNDTALTIITKDNKEQIIRIDEKDDIKSIINLLKKKCNE